MKISTYLSKMVAFRKKIVSPLLFLLDSAAFKLSISAVFLLVFMLHLGRALFTVMIGSILYNTINS